MMRGMEKEEPHDDAKGENGTIHPRHDRAYTNRGQLLSVKYTPNGGAQSDVADFVYDAGGRETTRNLGNGLTTTRENIKGVRPL